ncbi:SURF1 family protein [Plantibacter sp. VKM Ac-2880]|uniref:SURF1 family cytochrome oxidase biogenesis protein n=1 Tax=Plantibacter sp. VKM Ac-2880 TaxID=2783827 RepID=UPI00188F3261|nr:SURF1 family protein [Plantibacter sp. VKM Ac-2880]
MSAGWRFAFSRRWLGYLGVAIVFAIVCVLLSNWQLARASEKEEEVQRIATNWDATPIPLDEALPSLDSFSVADEWHPVSMSGTYLTDEQLLVRNRPRNNQAGFDVLTPLRLANGDVFIVDRGWVPAGDTLDAPESVPAPPSGEVSVVVRIRPGEPTLPGRGAADGQVATINLPQIAELRGETVYSGAYGMLLSERPAPAEAAPLGPIKPEPNEGMHLSYALQWVVFALMGFLFLAYAIRQEYRILNSDDPKEQRRAAARAERLANKARSDADIEDEILESHH